MKQITIDGVTYDLTPIQVKKDWEIIKVRKDFSDGGGYMLYELTGKNKFECTFSTCTRDKKMYTCGVIMDYIEWGQVTIQSIRRLSDGAIFSFGDKLIDGSIIKEFRISDTYPEAMLVTFEKFTEEKGVHICSINLIYTSVQKYVEPKKEPLFVTEDGIDVFTNDINIYSVHEGRYTIRMTTPRDALSPVTPNYYKYFSTKEAAEEYVVYHKPCLSIKDVKDHLMIDAVQEVILKHAVIKNL